MELDKVKKELDNIGQLAVDAQYKIDIEKYDIGVELESIEQWVKSVRRRMNKINK